MSKLFRTVVASSVIGGVALLNPLSAQAKDEPAVGVTDRIVNGVHVGTANGVNTTLDSCTPGGAPATGTVTGSTATGLGFTVRVPAAVATADASLESRARVFTYTASGGKSFSTKRTRVSNVADLATGTVAPGQFIWRFDVVDLKAEAAGALTALIFTSAGIAGCD
jgi:hypothetical protein